MLVAALDTATLTLTCALADVEAGEPVRVRRASSVVAPAKPKPGETGGHGGRLPGALVDLLRAEGLDLPAVEGYAIGLGPGSFTGLRIGLATWKGLAYAARRPLAGVSSLAAMALAAASDVPPGTLLVPLLDAKKGEVYAGCYRAEGDTVVAVAPDAALAPAALAAHLAALAGGDRARGFGNGYILYEALLSPSLPRLRTTVDAPTAAAVAALAAPALLALANVPFDPQPLFALEPRYVRASEAEVKFPNGFGPGARGA